MTNTSWQKNYQHKLVSAMLARGGIVEPVAKVFEEIVAHAAARAGAWNEDLIADLEDVLEWCVAEGCQNGADMGKLAKGIILGCTRSGRIEEDSLRPAYDKLTGNFFCHIIRSGSPIEKTSRAWVQGAIEGALARDWDAEESASAAAVSVVNALYRQDSAAGDLAREILEGGEINGIRITLREDPKQAVR